MSIQGISDYNGQTVKNLMKELVDDENEWKWEDEKNDNGKKHIYTINGEDAITTESRPSQNQPGNGRVSFYTFNDITKEEKWVPPQWNVLKKTLKDPSFPNYYENFISQPMDKVAQDNVSEDKKFQTAFLLQFEIARRVKEVPESPTREETEHAIRIALSHSAADHLLDMFTKKKYVPDLGFSVADFHGRRRAYEHLLTLEAEHNERKTETEPQTET